MREQFSFCLIFAIFSIVVFSSSVSAAACGGVNQRPCKVWERVPSCNKGLVENFRLNRCKRPAKSATKIKLFSSSQLSQTVLIHFLKVNIKDPKSSARERRYFRKVLNTVTLAVNEMKQLNRYRSNPGRFKARIRRSRIRLASLGSKIKKLEAEMETIRNKRQRVSTSFENINQKANQLYNLLSSLVRTMNEIRTAPSRNML